jgi:hypothetical protein
MIATQRCGQQGNETKERKRVNKVKDLARVGIPGTGR